ncbi:MAG TPA: pectinesterase family protein [Acidobacteriaceae bacterium]|jgi:polygalacturonase|nr:pectinesterase family protein [Acidobacteriaceae bacterium]
MRAERWAAVVLAAAVCGAAARAQDTRHVTEPKIPKACMTLQAELAARNGVLSDADERHLDTDRIQKAMDGCAPGRAVVLRAKDDRGVFLTGPLTMKSGVTLVIDANTVLAASRDPRVFDMTPGSCGVVNQVGHGCKGMIVADHTAGSGIMGDGSIDGRGGAHLLGQDVTWWELAHEAKVEDQAQSVPWMLQVRDSTNFTLYRVTLRNSPGYHVSVRGTDGFTAWGVKIMTPKTARNTDGIDPSSSRNVTITHCFLHTGDDEVAVTSSSAAGAASHISVIDNHFYAGHGMSIGSRTDGGVDHLLVENLTIDGADNGIRIKSDRSRGGLVEDATYRNVCMRDIKNPIVLTPMYTTFAGDKLPEYRKITLDNVHSLTPGAYTFLGLDAQHPLEATLDNVFAEGLDQSTMDAANAAITIGPRKGNLEPKGENVTLTVAPNSQPGTPLACEDKFVPFPSLEHAPELAGTVEPEDKTLYVAADGTGDFYSIQKAIDVAPKTGGAVISVAPGTYREVLTIDKPDVTLRSANPDASRTVVVMDNSAGTSGGTLHSATVNVTGDNFYAENITFQNDWNATHPQLPQGSQALALRVTGDRARFHNVRLLGNQDTLFTGSKACTGQGESRSCTPARQYFSECYIEGNVDFIFGDGKTVFDHCEIRSTPHSEGFLTAQGKSYATEDSGYVFHDCRLTAYPGVSNVYLGRPWRPYATVVYLDTEMGEQIQPAGWREWHPGETHSRTTAFYAEEGSTGPGAHPGEREPDAKQLTPDEVKTFLPENFLRGSDGWNPAAWRDPSPPTAAMPAEGQLGKRAGRGAPFSIVLVGDSTVATEGGWGPGFCATLTPNVSCIDDALNGRSTKSYIDEGAWKKALAEKGQYYFIQFGHNDQKPNPRVHADADTTYSDNLRFFIREVRTQGAVPILVTPLSRRNYRDGTLIMDDGLGDYAAAMRRVAAEEHVTLIDLYSLSTKYLSGMTQAEADRFDMIDHPDAKAEGGGADKPDRTHLNAEGKAVFGRMMADAVIRSEGKLRPDVMPAGANATAPAGTTNK